MWYVVCAKVLCLLLPRACTVYSRRVLENASSDFCNGSLPRIVTAIEMRTYVTGIFRVYTYIQIPWIVRYHRIVQSYFIILSFYYFFGADRPSHASRQDTVQGPSTVVAGCWHPSVSAGTRMLFRLINKSREIDLKSSTSQVMGVRARQIESRP